MSCGQRCPDQRHAPHSVEGALAWQVAGQMLRSGQAGAEVDVAGAVAVLTAEGVPAWVASTLAAAVATGVVEAQAEQGRQG